MTADEITYAELLASIGYSTETPQGRAECVSVCYQDARTPFTGMVRVWTVTPELAQLHAERTGRNLWFGVNALGEVGSGRGKADDVVRVSALIADLDEKEGGCPDIAAAFAIIADVSAVLGEYPVAVTYSGHGWQPFWGIEVESGRALVAESSDPGKRLLKRFHALLKKYSALTLKRHPS